MLPTFQLYLIDNYIRDRVLCAVFFFTQFYLKKSGVQVFQQSSHGENMMLEIIVDGNSKDQVSIQLLTKDQNLAKISTNKQKTKQNKSHSQTKNLLKSLNSLNSQI